MSFLKRNIASEMSELANLKIEEDIKNFDISYYLKEIEYAAKNGSHNIRFLDVPKHLRKHITNSLKEYGFSIKDYKDDLGNIRGLLVSW